MYKPILREGEILQYVATLTTSLDPQTFLINISLMLGSVTLDSRIYAPSPNRQSYL